MAEPAATVAGPTPRDLLRLLLPAAVIGVLSSLLLIAVIEGADQLEALLWDTLPDGIGVSGSSSGWIVLVLTVTGAAVGLVVWKVPGHAGPEPATLGLVNPPLPLSVLPGLLLALVFMLAGGVSLGPENPILGIGIGLTYAAGSRLFPGAPAVTWVGLGTAGMVGAMFGTPLAAALLLTEEAPSSQVKLWDRLFAPVAAAAAGAITTDLLGQPTFAVALPPFDGIEAIDLVSACGIAAAAAALGLMVVCAFPHSYAAFQRLKNPLVRLTIGGALLGVIGVIGGQITLFKGLEQMKELAADVDSYSTAELALIAIVKLTALLIAGTCGFRGGRIFPTVFIGVAIGLCACALVPGIPPAVAVSSATLGVLLAISRSGWLSIFMAATVVPEITLLPLLCVALLPSWLLVAVAPEMLVKAAKSGAEGEGSPPRDETGRAAA